MCSRSGPYPALVLAVALLLPLGLGCGHKDDPKPPPQKIPEPVRDLVVAQRGNELLLSFTYPQTTISGLPIEDIAAIELFEFEVAVPDVNPSLGDDDLDAALEEIAEEEAAAEEGVGDDEAPVAEETDTETEDDGASMTEAAETETAPDEMPAEEGDEESADDGADEEEDDDELPTVTKESLLVVDPREFSAAAKRVLRLEGDELSQTIHGDRVKLRLPLDEIDPEEKVGLVFGVRTFQILDRVSNFSNLAKIVPRVTPEPPTGLELEPLSSGVKITWVFEGEEPKEFRFYRRGRLAPTFDLHFGSRPGESDQFLDSTALFGNTYSYVMTAVIQRLPLVESAFTLEREIEYVDVFPPEAPTDLVVLPETGLARLLWERSADRDVRGYVIYRRTGGREFERLNEQPVREAAYVDDEASSGRIYAYRVVAVDGKGNMSEPSEEVEVRIP